MQHVATGIWAGGIWVLDHLIVKSMLSLSHWSFQPLRGLLGRGFIETDRASLLNHPQLSASQAEG